MIIKATSVLDLRAGTPAHVDARAANCNPRIVHFDPVGGLLQFFTNSAGSANEYVQTILFNDWVAVTTVPVNVPVEILEETPLPKEVNIDLADLKEPEPWNVEEPKTQPETPAPLEENSIKENDTWDSAYSKFPDLINADVKVFCGCPAYRWWGSQYELQESDTSLFVDPLTPPDIRDPGRMNIICKHLAAVIDRYF